MANAMGPLFTHSILRLLRFRAFSSILFSEVNAMNSQKTGQLIAQQRASLGLTQKQLANQLHISDRTVSRWERGVGYPDLSLLEPLADALELTVVELLRGERLPPEQQPAPQTEHTARDVVNTAGATARKAVRRFRWLLAVLAILVLLAGAACLWLAARTIPAYVPETITAVQAAALCPDCLITTGEYELVRELLELEEITSQFADDAALFLDESFAARYRDRVQVNGQSPEYFRIGILGRSLYVEYGTVLDARVLEVYPPDGTLTKHVYAYPSPPETITGPNPDGEIVTLIRPRDFSYFISNTDNAQFTQTVSRRVDPSVLSNG